MKPKDKATPATPKPTAAASSTTRLTRAAPSPKPSLAAQLPPLTGVAADQVGAEVQSFIDSGVQRLDVRPDGAGTFSIAPV